MVRPGQLFSKVDVARMARYIRVVLRDRRKDGA